MEAQSLKHTPPIHPSSLQQFYRYWTSAFSCLTETHLAAAFRFDLKKREQLIAFWVPIRTLTQTPISKVCWCPVSTTQGGRKMGGSYFSFICHTVCELIGFQLSESWVSMALASSFSLFVIISNKYFQRNLRKDLTNFLFYSYSIYFKDTFWRNLWSKRWRGTIQCECDRIDINHTRITIALYIFIAIFTNKNS